MKKELSGAKSREALFSWYAGFAERKNGNPGQEQAFFLSRTGGLPCPTGHAVTVECVKEKQARASGILRPAEGERRYLSSEGTPLFRRGGVRMRERCYMLFLRA